MMPLEQTTSVHDVADWVELSVAREENSMARPQIARAIEATSGTSPREEFLADVLCELEWRQQSYQTPPFRLDGTTVERAGDPLPHYVACLLLSLYGLPNRAGVGARLFERLAGEVAKAYFSGKARVVGWPAARTRGDRQEAAIAKKLRQLATDLGERFAEPPPLRFKDRGVDVVAWIPFADGRSSQAVILVQCAAGRNWETKAPIPLTSWQQYIHWATPPVCGFAVPCIVRREHWHEKANELGVLFDRLRIINCLPCGASPALARDLDRWVKTRVSQLQE